MKRLFKILLMMGIGLCFSQISHAQPCECPLKGGHFKDFSQNKYSHHDPYFSAVINSPDTDSVRTVLKGHVFCVLTFDSNIAVVMRTSDTTLTSYHWLSKVFVTEGDSLRIDDTIGLADKTAKGEFEISFSYYEKLRKINQESLLRCGNRSR
jgi:hypothetical protein